MLVQARSFTTENLPPAARRGAWHDYMEQAYYRVNVKLRDTESVRGDLRELRIGDLGISSFSADQQQVFRPKAAAAIDTSDNYVFIFPLREPLFFDQSGRSGFAPPGSVVLLRSSEWYEASCPDGFKNVTIKAPTSLLAQRVNGIDDLCANPDRCNSSLVRVVSAMAEELLVAHENCSVPSAPRVAECLTSLLTVMLEDANHRGAAESESPAATQDCFRRVCAFVRARLSDPDLSPLMTAQTQGVSVRYLHRLFQLRGLTFGRWLLEERLAAARRLIEAGSDRQTNLLQVAIQCGFVSQAHFSTRYRERFGEPPRETLKHGRSGPTWR